MILAIVILIDKPNVTTNTPKFNIIGPSNPKDCP